MRVLMIGMAALLAAGLAEDLPLVQPAELAAQLASKNPRPVIFQVGPNVLYRGKHIVGAIYAGPAAKPAGLDLLKEAAGKQDALYASQQYIHSILRLAQRDHNPDGASQLQRRNILR